MLLSATVAVTPAAATLFVDHANPKDFQTIQAAVNAASAGNTIKVAPGTYNEDVAVSKPLTILGGQVLSPGESGPSTVVFETTGFTVSSANKVTIEGFTIEADPASTMSTGNAILATNTAYSKFDSNVILDSDIELNGGVTHTEVANNSGFLFGISVQGNPSSNANDTFLHNTFNRGFGLALDASATGALVAGNTATESDGSAFTNYADDVTFIDNTATIGFKHHGSTDGFDDFGNNNTYIGNTAENEPGEGFSMDGGGTLTMLGNTANNNAINGMDIEAVSTATLVGNTADGNSDVGINVSANKATVLFNTMNNNSSGGITVDVLSGGTVIGNTANGNEPYGFRVLGPSVTIIGNTARNNSGPGFFFDELSQSTLSGNTADNNSLDGFLFHFSNDNMVSYNTADNNGQNGFEVIKATDNVFSHNTALGNAVFDLIDGSAGTGTTGTANTWTDNTANTAFPLGIL